MNKLEEARIKISKIDEMMVKLFEERMNAVKDVAEYKREQKLPIVDENREQSLILKNTSLLEHQEFEIYYHDFFEGVLKASKAYQKDLIK